MAALIAAVVLVALPAPAGSRTPSPETTLDPALFQALTVDTLASPGPIIDDAPLPAAPDTIALEADATFVDPGATPPPPTRRLRVDQPGAPLGIVVKPTPRPRITYRSTGGGGHASGGGWTYDPEVSWYGPGFYGGRTACGQAYTARSWAWRTGRWRAARGSRSATRRTVARPRSASSTAGPTSPVGSGTSRWAVRVSRPLLHGPDPVPDGRLRGPSPAAAMCGRPAASARRRPDGREDHVVCISRRTARRCPVPEAPSAVLRRWMTTPCAPRAPWCLSAGPAPGLSPACPGNAHQVSTRRWNAHPCRAGAAPGSGGVASREQEAQVVERLGARAEDPHRLDEGRRDRLGCTTGRRSKRCLQPLLAEERAVGVPGVGDAVRMDAR